MGNLQSKSNKDQTFNVQDWQPTQWLPFTNIKDPTYSSNFTVCAHKNNQNLQVQKYQLFFNSQAEYISYLQTYYQRKNYPTLVNSIYIEQTTKKSMCSTFHSANVYLQRIHFRLYELIQIPLEEGLYMIYSALDGYEKMFDKTGYFDVSSDMIGVNRQGKVKVWINRNFSKNFPEFNKIDHNKNQSDFIVNLVRMIESCIDYPKNKQTLSSFIIRKKQVLSFGTAKENIKQYLKFNKLCGQKVMKSIVLWIKKNFNQQMNSSTSVFQDQLRSSSFSSQFNYQNEKQKPKYKRESHRNKQVQNYKEKEKEARRQSSKGLGNSKNSQFEQVPIGKRSIQIFADHMEVGANMCNNRNSIPSSKVNYTSKNSNINFQSNFRPSYIRNHAVTNFYNHNHNIVNNGRFYCQYPNKEPIIIPTPHTPHLNTNLVNNFSNRQRQSAYTQLHKQKQVQIAAIQQKTHKDVSKPEKRLDQVNEMMLQNQRKPPKNITINSHNNNNAVNLTKPSAGINYNNTSSFYKATSGLYSPQNIQGNSGQWFSSKKTSQTTAKQKDKQKVKEKDKRSEFSKSLMLNNNQDDKKFPIYFSSLGTYEIDPDIAKDLNSFKNVLI